MTEGPTLLPASRSDKRTKEVFVVSLERISAGSSVGIGGAMDAVDGAPSREWIPPPGRGATVVVLVTVLVLNQCFSFCYNGLFLPGFQGKPPASRKPVLDGLKLIFSLLTVFTDVDL